MKTIQHTPEGVRDIYNVECEKKLSLENRLHKVIQMYGYHDIQTPTFEYFDVFGKDIGTTRSKELYKFFDKEGNTLVLRPDITPSIARAAATLFEDNHMPIRLCYTGNTFTNYKASYQGRLRETTQMGAELIGIDSVEADAEMLAMVADCMSSVGLKEFQLSVGNVEYFNTLIDAAALDEQTEERVRELINNRNFFGVEELLEEKKVTRSAREALVELGNLFGGVEVLKKAKAIAPNSRAVNAVKRLEKIYEVLKLYGVEDYISFDLSMNGSYMYYTGIIFRGYTFGTGDAVVKGGRYDHLLEKFGKESPSIGFVIVVDQLMNALVRQHIRISYGRKNTIVLYDFGKQKEAIKLVREFREKCKNTELIKKEAKTTVEEYINYGKDNSAGSLIYIKADNQIVMINLVTGEEKILHS